MLVRKYSYSQLRFDDQELAQAIDVFSDVNGIPTLLVREVEVDGSGSKDKSLADAVSLVEAEPGAP